MADSDSEVDIWGVVRLNSSCPVAPAASVPRVAHEVAVRLVPAQELQDSQLQTRLVDLKLLRPLKYYEGWGVSRLWELCSDFQGRGNCQLSYSWGRPVALRPDHANGRATKRKGPPMVDMPGPKRRSKDQHLRVVHRMNNGREHHRKQRIIDSLKTNVAKFEANGDDDDDSGLSNKDVVELAVCSGSSKVADVAKKFGCSRIHARETFMSFALAYLTWLKRCVDARL